MDVSSLGEALLRGAQDTAPAFGFWEVSTDEWNDGSGNVSVFLVDKYENEIEVVATVRTPSSLYGDLVWSEIEGRSAAAASCDAERHAERSQMGMTW